MNEISAPVDDVFSLSKSVCRYGVVYGSPALEPAGERGLVLAIIDLARRDFLFAGVSQRIRKSDGLRYSVSRQWLTVPERRHMKDAARFFLGADYRHYVELLGLPGDFLPEGVTAARCRYVLRA